VIPGGTFSQGKRIFTGDIYQTTGPAYTVNFDSSQVHASKVGTASIDFSPPALASGTALFSYSIGAVSQSKQIQRQPFGNASPNWGGDLTDIYWDPTQSGWGLTISQHGNNLFAVWYTYDTNGQPLFVVMPGATFNADGSFTGDLYTTTGPYFANATFDSSQVHATKVGTGTMVFDPVSGGSLFEEKSSTPLCRGSFLGCKSGRYNPCVHGGCYAKWISPQRYGYAAPDTPSPACEILYYDWTPCVGGTQTRTERTRDPLGCTGTPELSRACTTSSNPSQCNYTYGPPYGACVNGTRTHTVISATPAGCTGTPSPTEACTPSPCTVVNYSDWSACQSNNTQTRTVLSTQPPGCTFTPVTSQSCIYGGGTPSSAFDGTFSGMWTVTVTVFNPDGTTTTDTESGSFTVVIRNGGVSVNGAASSGTVTANGGIGWSATGSVGDCTYSGTVTASGGSGSVHCGQAGLYVADGNWSMSRTGP